MHTKDPKHTNALINESSPYLLQHAHNPVNWMPWGEEALAKAKEEGKPLLISIGYAACHWCHVMEHESFEDTAVAKLMNEKFVCIKVDREERPDVDQIYMDACQLIQQSGGWPLNAFALPDGRPFYAGTYYPKDNWISLLNQLSKYYEEKPEDAQLRANQITQGLNQMENLVKVEKKEDWEGMDKSMVARWKGALDLNWGGRGAAPKFPMPISWEYLLEYDYHYQDEKIEESILVTLNKMKDGGIYDQVGGGFSRYSVDAHWQVPHFEKMLYDNAQLVSLYSNAYKKTKNPEYKQVIEESIAFVERELMHEDGGFYASLDADSEGEEGKFYVWDYENFIQVLEEHGVKNVSLVAKYYNVKKAGNWEHTNVLWLDKHSHMEFIKRNDLDKASWEANLGLTKSVLLKERAKRIRPGLDDKILTSWNALMIRGLCDAYQATGEEKYVSMAKKNMLFLQRNILKDATLYRNYKFKNGKGRASIAAFLDDYAQFIDALTALYEVTFEETYVLEAKSMTYYVLDHFFNASNGMFYYTSEVSEKLVARKMELSDNVIPASNSVMAMNLFKLGAYFPETKWKKMSEQMLLNMLGKTVENGAFYSNWARQMNRFAKPFYEVVIMGPNAVALQREMQQTYLPNVVYAGGKKEGKLPLLEYKLQEGETWIYVCSGGICKQPVQSVEEAFQLIK